MQLRKHNRLNYIISATTTTETWSPTACDLQSEVLANTNYRQKFQVEQLPPLPPQDAYLAII